MLPRCWSSLAAAALFLALVTAGEITVTDMMLISTFAEEIHTQFTLGEQAALARTLLLSLPALLIVVLGLAWVGARIERRLPPLPFLLRSHRPLRFEPRAFWSLVSWLLLGVALLPCASLVWKVGLTGQPRIWSPAQAWHQLGAEGRLLGGAVTETLLVALITGGLVAGLALFCCWLAQESRWLRAYLLAMLTTAWVLPGPVVGIGLKELILRCVEALPYGPWSQALYHGPSPLPIVWVSVIRFLPPAVFFLWPVVRTIPVELREAVRLDGAGPFQEWANLVWPLTRRATEVVALAVSALCLGEVAASVRVETPGWESFAKLLFDRMHYGVDANVSALALLLLGSLTALALIGIILIRLFARR
jgi:iron(III) transport system permease protein